MPTFTVVSRAPSPQLLDREDVIEAADEAAARAAIEAERQPPAVVISSVEQHAPVQYPEG